MKITFIKTGKRVKPKEKKTNKSIEIKNINKSEMFKTVFRKNQIVLLTLALMLVTAGYMNYNNNGNELNIELAELGDAKLVSANATENDTISTDTSENTSTNETTNVDVSASTNETESVDMTASTNEAENAETTASINETENKEVNSSANETENVEVTSSANETTNVDMTESANSKVNASTDAGANSDYFTQTRLERQTMYSQMLDAYKKILENEKIPSDQKSIAANEIKNINDRINAISIVENLIETKGFEDVIILINDNSINVVVKQEKNLSDEQVAQILNIVSRELKVEIGDIHITIHN